MYDNIYLSTKGIFMKDQRRHNVIHLTTTILIHVSPLLLDQTSWKYEAKIHKNCSGPQFRPRFSLSFAKSIFLKRHDRTYTAPENCKKKRHYIFCFRQNPSTLNKQSITVWTITRLILTAYISWQAKYHSHVI